MTERQRLQNRRDSETITFAWLGMKFVMTISRFANGKVAEIFLSNGRVNSHADTAARDSAVVASLAMQHGVELDTIRKALLRDEDGTASGPLGVALDLIAAMNQD